MTDEEERTLITVFNNEVAAYIHDHFKPGTTGEHLTLQHNAHKHALARAIERERERCAGILDRRRNEQVPVVINMNDKNAKIDEAVFFALAYAAQEIRGGK